MVLAIVSFGWAAILPEGAAIGFVLICLASGAAMAADMVILPATFANAVSRLSLPEGLGFGLWAFAAKLALALAAAVALPALARAGFDPASDLPSTTAALGALAFAYAVVPCFLKLLSIALLVLTPRHVLDATPDRTAIGAAPQGAP
jgi:Na+/melibiose symporter-like transporter